MALVLVMCGICSIAWKSGELGAVLKKKTPFETNRGGKVAKHQVVAYTEKSQDKHESRHIQLVREYGFHPRSKVQVEDGALLPRKFEPFPDDMYGRPLEEIDNFIYEEVFGGVN
uniref:Uncharacterized protein n=1 Tax=Anopheles farauti TaxID=69004 RepID=A0A182QEW2_9DIPT